MKRFTAFSKSHNTIELLKVVAAMQLIPSNHGKNVRLESLARITLANKNEATDSVSLEELKQILDAEFPKSQYEDQLDNLFTENINFIQGNYVVFPGTTVSASSVLNNLLKAIYELVQNDKIAKDFSAKLYSAIFLLLQISDNVAKQCDFARNHSVKIKDKLLELPSDDRRAILTRAVVFSHEWLLEHSKMWKTSPEIIEEFLIDPKNPELLGTEYDYSPLQLRPILKMENEYLIVQPTSLVHALINFIWEETEKANYKEELLRVMNETVWDEASVFIRNMMWMPTNIELPPSKPELRCKEDVYLIDLNKQAYVCFIETGYYKKVSNQEELETSKEILDHGNLIQNRQTEVIGFLKKKFPDCEFLTFFVLSEVGYSQAYSLPKTEKNYLSLIFTSTELKHISNFEEPDPLILWKFAIAFLELTSNSKIINAGGNLDIYVAYFQNDYSCWPKDEERPALAVFMPGMCALYVQASILKVDIHSALYIKDGNMLYHQVYNYCDYGPFYAIIGDRYRTSVYLEGFIAPIWFSNVQSETHHQRQISSQLEMFAFWLNQMKASIEENFTLVTGDKPIMVNVHLDPRFKKEMRAEDMVIVPIDSISIPIEVKDSVFNVTIPLELAHWFATHDNEAERRVLSTFLDELLLPKSGDKKQKIKEIIDLEMPRGPAKMASMLGANNLQLENRYLPDFRPVKQHDLSNIRVNITRAFKVKVDPGHFSNAKSKQKLTFNIGTAIYNALIPKLHEYDPLLLLPILLNYNEACVQQRAVQELDLPARLACLGYDSHHVSKLFNKEQERIKAALAVRCLVEFIVAGEVSTGKKLPNLNDIDELIAMMYEVIEWARLSDTIKLGLSDPEMKLLHCGRIDVDFSSMNEVMAPLTLTKSQIEIDRHNREFESLFTQKNYSTSDVNHPEALKINEAFRKEWGVSFSDIYNFIMDLVHFTRLKNGSTVHTDKDSLYKVLQSEEYKWKNDQITAALNVLCLVPGWQSGKPPAGFDITDTYPWKYNRALSFIRRPIVRFTKNNETHFMWSYRHLLASFDNLMVLLSQGILWSPEGGPISEIVKDMNTNKGKIFRNETYEWFKANSDLEIISYEVFIGPGMHLENKELIGDIDVMAIDRKNKIVYSIECKNTIESKTSYEFTLEMNKYLGSGNYLDMHVRRDNWLKNNSSIVSTFIKDKERYIIRSIFITAFELPLVYLKKNLPLPFTSLPKLMMNGIKSLEELYTTHPVI